MITSCSGSRQYDFKSSEDALKQYQAFFQTIKGHSDSDAEQLAELHQPVARVWRHRLELHQEGSFVQCAQWAFHEV